MLGAAVAAKAGAVPNKGSRRERRPGEKSWTRIVDVSSWSSFFPSVISALGRGGIAEHGESAIEAGTAFGFSNRPSSGRIDQEMAKYMTVRICAKPTMSRSVRPPRLRTTLSVGCEPV
jgi:hypothetical protein